MPADSVASLPSGLIDRLLRAAVAAPQEISGEPVGRFMARLLIELADRDEDLLLHTYLATYPSNPPTFSVRVGHPGVAEPDEMLRDLAVSRALRAAAGRVGITDTVVEMIAAEDDGTDRVVFRADPGEELAFLLPAEVPGVPDDPWARRLRGWASSLDEDGLGLEPAWHPPRPLSIDDLDPMPRERPAPPVARPDDGGVAAANVRAGGLASETRASWEADSQQAFGVASPARPAPASVDHAELRQAVRDAMKDLSLHLEADDLAATVNEAVEQAFEARHMAAPEPMPNAREVAAAVGAVMPSAAAIAAELRSLDPDDSQARFPGYEELVEPLVEQIVARIPIVPVVDPDSGAGAGASIDEIAERVFARLPKPVSADAVADRVLERLGRLPSPPKPVSADAVADAVAERVLAAIPSAPEPVSPDAVAARVLAAVPSPPKSVSADAVADRVVERLGRLPSPPEPVSAEAVADAVVERVLAAIPSPAEPVSAGAVADAVVERVLAAIPSPAEPVSADAVADAVVERVSAAIPSVPEPVSPDAVAAQVVAALPTAPPVDAVAERVIALLPRAPSASDVATAVGLVIPVGPSADEVASRVLARLPLPTSPEEVASMVADRSSPVPSAAELADRVRRVIPQPVPPETIAAAVVRALPTPPSADEIVDRLGEVGLELDAHALGAALESAMPAGDAIARAVAPELERGWARVEQLLATRLTEVPRAADFDEFRSTAQSLSELLRAARLAFTSLSEEIVASDRRSRDLIDSLATQIGDDLHRMARRAEGRSPRSSDRSLLAGDEAATPPS